MGLKLAILGSGSSGNSALLESDGCRVLIDMGFSAKRTNELLKGLGHDLSRIDAIFLTHEHGDHTAGLTGLSKHPGIPVFANPATARVLGQKLQHAPHWQHFETGSRFQFRDLTIETFSVPHDAQDPVGFVFACGGTGEAATPASLAWLTDLGHVPENVRLRIRDVDTLSIEANHCRDMLDKDTKRPWSLRQRISGRHGHLSNRTACEVLTEINGPRWRRIILTHMSRDCNSRAAVESAFAGAPFSQRCEVSIIEPDQSTPLFDLT